MMLDDPFFTNYSSRQARPVPVQQDHLYSSPKVVPVPAHFVSSDRPQVPLSVSKESAALKIQRVFRGFFVRRSVKNISSIRNEVFKVERSVDDTEIVELIRIDAKERLRVNETLMSLLFKLDSIRGVDFGVRDFRKAVINKAIALLEMVDSIVAAKNRSAETDSEIACKITSEQVPESSSFRDRIVDDPINLIADTDSVMNADAVIDVNCNHVEVVDECGEDDYALKNTETEGERTDDKKRSIQFLEKLMDDNEKMMTIMTQIFERNELQTRMLNSLSQRVEQLEQAFVFEKPRKKKKRHSA